MILYGGRQSDSLNVFYRVIFSYKWESRCDLYFNDCNYNNSNCRNWPLLFRNSESNDTDDD